MKKALIYCRTTSLENRDSIESQLKLTRLAISNSKDYELAENGTYTDIGQSGMSMERAALSELMLRIISDDEIKAVYVYNSERISRSVYCLEKFTTFLKKFSILLFQVQVIGIEETHVEAYARCITERLQRPECIELQKSIRNKARNKVT
ncbi:recombinase family protein [Candidatus Parcubacteria bacterium]|nr:recombinase family protein [Candidatus Parcubacteria bacterium]